MFYGPNQLKFLANQNNSNDLSQTFIFTIHIHSDDIFLLDCNKIHKKQKFSANDIVESGSKEIWSVSYVPCVDTIAQVSLTQWFFR